MKAILWIIFFFYSTSAALIFQQVILPLFQDFHGVGGLVYGGDSVYFHQVAVELAESVRVHGWSKWTIWPAQGATGNVSFLAILYVFFGSHPSLMIPINAAMHATSGIIILLIAQILQPGKLGVYSGVITAILFIIFPSALNWYAQIHKDGFVILGMLIILYSWVKGIQHSSIIKTCSWIIFGTLIGLSFVVLVRPYNIDLLILLCVFVFLISFFYVLFTKSPRKKYYLPLIFLLLTAVLVYVGKNIPRADIVEDPKKQMVMYDPTWQWRKSDPYTSADKSNLFSLINSIGFIRGVAEVRVHNILYSQEVKAGSLIDENVKPDSVWAVFGYTPRALQIALFAPFPNKWFKDLSVIRLVSVAETAVWYLLIPGFFFAFCYCRSLPLLVLTVTALLFLTIYGFVIPNLGTLYRIRYVYLFLLMLVGTVGWVEMIIRQKQKDKSHH